MSGTVTYAITDVNTKRMIHIYTQEPQCCNQILLSSSSLLCHRQAVRGPEVHDSINVLICYLLNQLLKSIIQTHPLPTHIHTGSNFPARKNTEMRVKNGKEKQATAGRNPAAPNIQTSPGGCATLAGGTDGCAYLECLHVCPCTCVVSVLVFVTVTFPSPSAQSSLFRVNHVVLYSQLVIIFAVLLLLPATACYYRNKIVLYKSTRRIIWSLQSLLQCTTTSFDTSQLQAARS